MLKALRWLALSLSVAACSNDGHTGAPLVDAATDLSDGSAPDAVDADVPDRAAAPESGEPDGSSSGDPDASDSVETGSSVPRPDAPNVPDARIPGDQDAPGCADECTEGVTRCRDGYQSVCERQVDGCSGWSDAEPCASGSCADDAACLECSELCTPDAARCNAGSIERCRIDSDGCTRWEGESACVGGACADELTCGFTVQGRVDGLRGEVSLLLDADTSFSLTREGPFELPTALPDGAFYQLVVASQPVGQQCALWNAGGRIEGATVSDLRVACRGEPLGNLQNPLLLKADAPDEGDAFGTVVASDGDTLVVGAPDEAGSAQSTVASPDNQAGTAGAVYVFVRDGDSWVQQAYLKASNADSDDRFGSSVAIRGDFLAVGAPREASDAAGVGGDASRNALPYAGAVYVFRRQGSKWTEQAYVKSPRPASNTFFGNSVALEGPADPASGDGYTLVVGAPFYSGALDGDEYTGAVQRTGLAYSGAVFLYVSEGATWSLAGDLVASNRAPNDYFGASVVIDGDTLAVSALGEAGKESGTTANPEDDGALGAGAVYVFERDGGQWLETQYLKASNPGPGDWFGSSLALSGDLLAVGSFEEDGDVDSDGTPTGDNDAASSAGAVYVFERQRGAWLEPVYLKANNAEAGDRFSDSLALRGTTLVVGAPSEAGAGNGTTGNPFVNGARGAGAAYVFNRSAGEWSQTAYLKGLSGDAQDYLGTGVALIGDAVAVGVKDEGSATPGPLGDPFDNGAPGAGAVIVYESCDPGNQSCAFCAHACLWEGYVACNDGMLSTCELGQDGCLAWGVASACEEGVCADDRSCLECPFECAPGETTCLGGRLGTCEAATPACFELADAADCAEAFCFDSARCAQTAFVEWGSTGSELPRALAAIDGALYILGSTTGALTGNNLGERDLFLTKLESDGTVLWHQQWGSALEDQPGGVLADQTEGVTVFSGVEIDLGNNQSQRDLCLTRWSHQGVEQWRQCWGETYDEYARGLARAADGDLLLTGEAYVGFQDRDVFVEKRSRLDGSLVWRTWLGTPRTESAVSLVDVAGDVYVTGMSEGDLGVGGNGGTDSDVFVAKLSDAGDVVWIVEDGSPGHEFVSGIAADAAGDLYVVGWAPRTLAVTSPDSDGFLLKVSPDDGSVHWIRRWGTYASEQGRAVAVGADGVILVASVTDGALAGPSQGANDIVLARWSAAGEALGERQWGTANADNTWALLATSGAVYLSGDTRGAFTPRSNAGEEDAFVLSLAP